MMESPEPLQDGKAFMRSVSASLLRLRAKTPFFATLALFAEITPSHRFDTAATNGRDIWINPEFWAGLSPAEADGLLLHEVLHAALLHVSRRGERNPLLWNYAADVVVNAIVLKETPLKLPPGHLYDSALAELSVEEAYEILQRDAFQVPRGCTCDLIGSEPGKEQEGLSEQRRRLLESYWQQAREQATLVAGMKGQGSLPAGLRREVGQLQAAQLPWKHYLWRYLVRNPCDFEEFDSRLLSRGLYLEALQGEKVRVFVCIDTSGSVSDNQMKGFLSEVHGILRAYPHLECKLFYADATLNGPFSLQPDEELPAPSGGGGTDFRPFFKWLSQEEVSGAVSIYLTDGFGEFPANWQGAEVLWVVTPGGLELGRFPFGEAVRLLSD